MEKALKLFCRFWFFALIPILVTVLIVIGLITADSWCERQINIVSAVVGIGTFLALLLYAYLTRKIAEGTAENAEINKANLANFYPSFSFYKDVIQSYGGTFAKGKVGSDYVFRFFIHNKRAVPGFVSFNFEFFYINDNGEKQSSTNMQFSNMYLGNEWVRGIPRRYLMQPYEYTSVKAYFNEAAFGRWIDEAYPNLATGIRERPVSVNHKIEAIRAAGLQGSGAEQRSKLRIEMTLEAEPHEITKSRDVYRIRKTFYLRFDGTNHTYWKILGETTS